MTYFGIFMINKIKEIIEIIEIDIRPRVQGHNGDIEFISYSNNIVTVKLTGSCINCPIAFYTLKLGVLQTLQKTFPEISDVVQE